MPYGTPFEAAAPASTPRRSSCNRSGPGEQTVAFAPALVRKPLVWLKPEASANAFADLGRNQTPSRRTRSESNGFRSSSWDVRENGSGAVGRAVAGRRATSAPPRVCFVSALTPRGQGPLSAKRIHGQKEGKRHATHAQIHPQMSPSHPAESRYRAPRVPPVAVPQHLSPPSSRTATAPSRQPRGHLGLGLSSFACRLLRPIAGGSVSARAASLGTPAWACHP